jgi:superfamily II DNA or RNA helicase
MPPPDDPWRFVDRRGGERRQPVLPCCSDLGAKKQDWKPDLLVLDEAHRVKSADAKRTFAAISLSASAGGCLAMSGTPVQNNTNEPAVLLHVINPGAYHEVRQEKISVERIKALLQPVMLRRKKADVLKELPPVTEQVVNIRVRIDGEDEELNDIIAAGKLAAEKGAQPKPWAAGAAPIIKHLALAWSSGQKLAQFEVVRERLGLEKARNAAAIDFIQDALENKGCLVVFTAHHDASDALAASIRKSGWRVEVADARVRHQLRQPLVFVEVV